MTPSPQRGRFGDGRRARHRLAVAKRFLAEGWRVALLDIEGELLRKERGERLAAPDHTLSLH